SQSDQSELPAQTLEEKTTYRLSGHFNLFKENLADSTWEVLKQISISCMSFNVVFPLDDFAKSFNETNNPNTPRKSGK
ncbi:MAG: hypothetical protein JO131_09690, partial [Gammaproteobacteria bacterium]|nr:hypothetical protein [Gammaproteobacteria bacterium]